MAGRRAYRLILILLLVTLSPALALAQQPKAGVVTAVQGQATLKRPVLPQPLPVKFKDDVFLRDRIDTRENSVVRVLLGGKALVTVRELSVFTVTEEPGKAVLDLQSGRVAVSVARSQMKPGESIEVRTQNAVAAVRGSVGVITAGEKDGKPVTEVAVLDGIFTVSHRGSHIAPFDVGANLIATIFGDAFGPLQRMTDAQRNAYRRDTQTPKSTDKAAAGDQANQNSIDTTTQLADTLANKGLGGEGGGGPVTPPPPTGDLLCVQCPRTTQEATSTSSQNLISNGGFETGDLTGWTLSGAGQVISQFGTGTISPAEGSFMFLGHTGTGAISQSCTSTTACQTSTLSQTFTATKSLLLVTFKYLLLTNEVNCVEGCSFGTTPTGASSKDDKWQVRLIPASGSPITAFQTSASTETFVQNPVEASSSGFTLLANGGESNGFQTFSNSAVVALGDVTIEFSVSDIGDTLFDSGALLDAVVVQQDPPLYFLRDGSAFVRTDPAPLLRLIDTSMTFDSLMVVCCGSSASLAGPLLRATNSDLTVPFSLLSVIQGGTFSTSSTEPLALLEGGSHSIGSLVGIFDIAGVNTAVDPTTGLAIGTDRPFQHNGVLLETSGATVATRKVMEIDTALLEASAPLLNLTAASTLTTNQDAFDLSYRAKVTSLGPLVRLDGSTLNVLNGALINLSGGSYLGVTGDLIQLSNGSTLNLFNGPLLSVSSGSVLNVSGALVAFGGSGGNIINITNSLCNSSCFVVGGIPVALLNGASSSNVSITNPIKNAGLGSINLASSNTAAVVLSGSTSKVTISGN